MAEHTIEIPDSMAGRELRRIVWNDETGEVSGDHSDIRAIRATIEAAPVERDSGGRVWLLEDPGHNPAEFLTMLSILDWRILGWPELRATLPAVFDCVELPSGKKAEDLYTDDPETGEPVLLN